MKRWWEPTRKRQEIVSVYRNGENFTHRDAQTSLSTRVAIKIENLWWANEEPWEWRGGTTRDPFPIGNATNQHWAEPSGAYVQHKSLSRWKYLRSALSKRLSARFHKDSFYLWLKLLGQFNSLSKSFTFYNFLISILNNFPGTIINMILIIFSVINLHHLLPVSRNKNLVVDDSRGRRIGAMLLIKLSLGGILNCRHWSWWIKTKFSWFSRFWLMSR